MMNAGLWGAVIGAVLGSVLGGTYYVLTLAAWRPWGFASEVSITGILVGLLWFTSLVGFCVAPLGLFWPATRRSAIYLMAQAATCGGVLTVAFIFAANVEERGIATIIERARPLVRAISRYESEHGHPPVALHVLFPKYLAALPTTGSAAFPRYNYEMHNSGWALTVSITDFGPRHLRYDTRPDAPRRSTVRTEAWFETDPS